MPQDDAPGSMWRGLCSLLSTLELGPGRYVLRLSDPRPTQDGLILNEVCFTVERPESERPTSGSQPSLSSPGFLSTCGDGLGNSATLWSGTDDPLQRGLKRLFEEPVWMQDSEGVRLTPYGIRRLRG
jgi:hypothetical protein